MGGSISKYVFRVREATYSDTEGMMLYRTYGERGSLTMAKTKIHWLETCRETKIPMVILECQKRPAKYMLLLSHGNIEDLGIAVTNAASYADFLECDICLYEYSGFGIATGKPSESNCYADIFAVYDYLVHESGVDPGKIVLFGRSMGSGPTLFLASHRRVAAVILVAAFLSCARVVQKFKVTPAFDLFPNIDRIGQISCEVMYIHGKNDQIVPITHGFELAKRTKRCAPPLWIDGAGHNNIEKDHEMLVLPRIKGFLDQLDVAASTDADYALESHGIQSKHVAFDIDHQLIEDDSEEEKVTSRSSSHLPHTKAGMGLSDSLRDVTVATPSVRARGSHRRASLEVMPVSLGPMTSATMATAGAHSVHTPAAHLPQVKKRVRHFGRGRSSTASSGGSNAGRVSQDKDCQDKDSQDRDFQDKDSQDNLDEYIRTSLERDTLSFEPAEEFGQEPMSTAGIFEPSGGGGGGNEAPFAGRRRDRFGPRKKAPNSYKEQMQEYIRKSMDLDMATMDVDGRASIEEQRRSMSTVYDTDTPLSMPPIHFANSLSGSRMPFVATTRQVGLNTSVQYHDRASGVSVTRVVPPATVKKLRRLRMHLSTTANENYDDFYLLRFLRARKFNVPAAVELLSTYERLGSEIGYDLRGRIPLVNVRRIVNKGICYVTGAQDSRGCPVLFIRANKFMPRETSWQEVLMLLLFFLDFINDCGEVSHGGICIVVDMFQWSRLNFSADCTRRFFSFLQRRYPMQIRSLYVVGAPLLLKHWMLVRPMIKASLAKVMTMRMSTAQLQQEIPTGRLPDFLGGSVNTADVISLLRPDLFARPRYQ